MSVDRGMQYWNTSRRFDAHDLWLRVIRQAPMFLYCPAFTKPHLGRLSAQENNLGQRARGLFRWIFGNMLYTEQQNTNTSKLNNSQLAAPLVGKTNNEKRCH
jgi:hypothetical protein